MTDVARDKRSLLAPGKHVGGGRYSIEGVIGEGASSVVYLARRESDGSRVALKVIHRHLCHDRQIFARFRREASILGRLEGPHLVKLLDFIQEDDLLMIALEHVDGTSLETRLHERPPISIGEAVEITLQVCAALGVAHAAGVVHRDLKPGNVLLEHDGPDRRGIHVRVVDFGLAKVVHGEHMTTGLTEQDMIFGTPEYMAPEQARGEEVDARCDIYTAGVMLYEMAVGEVPFRGRTPIAVMTAHLTQEPTPPRMANAERGISPALEAVILRAMSKNRADRYESSRAFAEALAAARDEPLVIAPRPVEDAHHLATVDTDLHLSTSSIGHGPTLPSDPASEPPTGANAPTDRSSGTTGAVDRTSRSSSITLAAESSSARVLWTVVAVVALGAGIALGVLIGSK